MILDNNERQQALNITQSYIVQAPAGSGKTELLIQRYLALLANVQHTPEQILAITFTRKAAQEMQTRIIKALNFAKHHPEPTIPHQQKTWQLAQAVLQRDKKENWQLLQNPNRLAIQTFDGFCARLTRQLPILTGFGAMPEIVENANLYYQQAAQQVWLTLTQQSQWTAAVKNLLWHVDNQLPKLQQLIADLLARREQWLDYVGNAQEPERLAEVLQTHLQNLIGDVLQRAGEMFPLDYQKDLLELLAYSQANIGSDLPPLSSLFSLLSSRGLPAGSRQNARSCLDPAGKPRDDNSGEREHRGKPRDDNGEEFLDYTGKPLDDNRKQEHNINQLALWRAIAHLLLTNEGQVRKRIDKNLGFPPKTEGRTPAEKEEFQQRKEAMQTLLTELAQYPDFIAALQQVQQLPPAEYDKDQQKVLVDLLEVLTLAVAQLMVLFQQHGVCDFNQILLGALQALGTMEQPSDLALALDYKIQHILVDEFQDTSVAQFRLIEKLISGWMPGDGRTLFLVGDPMQSIYRFRQAEVGLFLAAKQHGIGQVALVPLTLQVNFRSGHNVVEWINDNLSVAFPQHPDIGVGAVPFAKAQAFHKIEHARAQLHMINDEVAQAQKVVHLVQEALADPDHATIGILVRTRAQLEYILPTLQEAQIDYQAVEIESLSNRPVLQDLLALTRALLHPSDRLAWLAVLRAPWCKMSLAELTHLIALKPQACVWDSLQAIENWSLFSSQTQQVLPSIINILAQQLVERQRLPVCQWIFNTWLALGGAQYYLDPTANTDARLFFDLLEELGLDIYSLSADELETKVARIFATPKNMQSRLQIMTIHKAKGLEFDTVIIPGLHSSPRADNKPLLTWWERPRAHGAEVLIAPLHPFGAEEDKLYKYIWSQRQRAAELEATRLLYVAVTRARIHLHMLGVVEVDEEGMTREPTSNSLLSIIMLSKDVIPAKAGIHLE